MKERKSGMIFILLFQTDGIEILFPPYQVASYADGSHAVKVPYQKVVKLLRSEFISYLNLEHLNVST
jgi:hypothetical protein